MATNEKAYFAGGCFWCTEAIFMRLKGVSRVTSGYMGGGGGHPTYEDVHAGSGDAETIEVVYDPEVIPYERLLDVFFGTHDPTTKNRQGADIGAEYRSSIFYISDEQRRLAESTKARLEADRVFSRPIVTTIIPAVQFTPAEDEHQDFYAKNPEQPYCQVVIDPKIAKLRARFSPYLKDDPLQKK